MRSLMVEHSLHIIRGAIALLEEMGIIAHAEESREWA